MNEQEHDPLPTSIQAGAPIPAAPAPDAAGSIDIAVPTACDRFVAAIKPYERWGLAFGVVLQFLVLGAMIVLGGAKALGGGVFH